MDGQCRKCLLREAFPDAAVRVPDKTPEEAAAAYAWAGIKEV